MHVLVGGICELLGCALIDDGQDLGVCALAKQPDCAVWTPGSHQAAKSADLLGDEKSKELPYILGCHAQVGRGFAQSLHCELDNDYCSQISTAEPDFCYPHLRLKILAYNFQPPAMRFMGFFF